MKILSKRLAFLGLLALSLSMLLAAGSAQAATKGVTVGNAVTGLGFTDDTSGTGGLGVVAMTAINPGDTVHWHWSTVGTQTHTVTSDAAIGGPFPPPGSGGVACGTGDNFDSFTSGVLLTGPAFDHTFNTPGICSYFCEVHLSLEQGQVFVGVVPTTTTTTTTSTTTTTAKPGKGCGDKNRTHTRSDECK